MAQGFVRQKLSPLVILRSKATKNLKRSFTSVQDDSGGQSSLVKADSNTYANKIILAAYDATGKVLGLRVVDFTSTDKEADYVDIATLTSAPSGKITVKSMIFDGLGTINPLTARGKVDFLN